MRIRTAVIDGLRALPAELAIRRRTHTGPCRLEIGETRAPAAREAAVRVLNALKRANICPAAGTFSVDATPESEPGTELHDVPIALGVLAAANRIDEARLHGTLSVGALSPRGKLAAVRGMFPIAGLSAQLSRKLIGPSGQRTEAAWAGPVQTVLRHDLAELLHALREGCEAETIGPETANPGRGPGPETVVPGHAQAKRALEIAVAGGHPLLIHSNGRSPIHRLCRQAAEWPGPLLTDEWKALTTTRAVAGLLDPEETGRRERPFRAPHHAVSAGSIQGRSSARRSYDDHETARRSRPGEAALAHGGILYLEEVDRFHSDATRPLQAACSYAVMGNGNGTMAADIILIGNLQSETGDEHRTTGRQLSERHPLQDTFQCTVHVPYEAWTGADSEEAGNEERHRRLRIRMARDTQQRRYHGRTTNGRAYRRALLTEGRPGDDALQHIPDMDRRLGAKRTTDAIRIARTIADLRGDHETTRADLLAAERMVHEPA